MQAKTKKQPPKLWRKTRRTQKFLEAMPETEKREEKVECMDLLEVLRARKVDKTQVKLRGGAGHVIKTGVRRIRGGGNLRLEHSQIEQEI